MAVKFALLISVFVAFGTVHAETAKESPDWETANCRIQSNLDSGKRGHSFLQAKEKRDLELGFETCRHSIRSMAISGSIGDDLMTQKDAGYSEFRNPNTNEPYARCGYYVEAGRRVSPALKAFSREGFERGANENFEDYLKRFKAIEQELEALVNIECLMM